MSQTRCFPIYDNRLSTFLDFLSLENGKWFPLRKSIFKVKVCLRLWPRSYLDVKFSALESDDLEGHGQGQIQGNHCAYGHF